METRYLGNSGLEVSVVGLGTNNFGGRMDQEATTAVVRASMDLGITLFDTADIYGGSLSEQYLGKALGADRHDVIIATKFGMSMGEGPFTSGASRRYIMSAVEDSLRRLGTDYIDLYQVHQPDRETPLEETMRALDDLVRDGKVRYIGNSNYDGWEIASGHYIAQRDSLTPFISAQNNYSLLERSIETEIAPACEAFGLGMLPFFPLASGLLTGKYRRDEAPPEGTRLAGRARNGRIASDRNWDIVERLDEWAREHDHTLLDLAFAWLASKPFVGSVIAGATRVEQVEANVAAGDWRLTPEEMAEVDAIAR
ncbi:MAG: aldo/keto reductase [Chloroflexota bacterium]|nr:aldo/keto reductase [Chloroflexota bacterium]